MSKEYVYFANATLADGSDIGAIDLEEPGWANKEMLAQTVRWSLVPKPGAKTIGGGDYPVVQIAIPQGAKPIFRTRVYMSTVDYVGFRCYCIGWKKGRTFVWTWVLPTGSIEVGTGDDSHLADVLRTHINNQIKAGATFSD